MEIRKDNPYINMDVASLYPNFLLTREAANEKTKNFGRLIAFCNKHGIKLEVEKDYLHDCIKFRFIRNGHEYIHRFTREEYRDLAESYMNNFLIERLIREFNLEEKENNTMSPKNNYTDYVRFSGMDFDGDFIRRDRYLAKPEIKNVIFNDPATIVYWTDGTKTVVKCQEGDIFDKEKGLAMAICKKMLGTNKSGANFNDIFKKWIPEEKEVCESDISKAMNKLKEGLFSAFMNPPKTSKTINVPVAEFAKIANVSVSTIRKQCAAGQLQGAHKVNGKWYIPVLKKKEE